MEGGFEKTESDDEREGGGRGEGGKRERVGWGEEGKGRD